METQVKKRAQQKELTDVKVDALDDCRRPYHNGDKLSKTPLADIANRDVFEDENELTIVVTNKAK
jgi:hypothetical protein